MGRRNEAKDPAAGGLRGRRTDAAGSGATVPITLVVLTRDEERNLRACLESARGWTLEQLVVDSGSADRTVEIARECGAEVVTHAFETHAKQWNWALQNLPIRGEWVLALDADQRVTAELRDEILETLAVGAPDGAAGYFVRRRQIFRGRWIRYGGYYPKHLLKLFRREAAWVDEKDLVDHHFRVRGPVAILRGDLIEDNRNEAAIAVWIEKHNRYARLQAEEELFRSVEDVSSRAEARLFGSPDERVLWLKSVWRRLPLYVRPFLYFSYRYFLRAGFLDGKEGFLFHFLQAFWYRLLVDVHLEELRAAPEQPGRPEGTERS